jgi:hypothetical protein
MRLLLIAAILVTQCAAAQKDTAGTFFISIHFGGHLPGADMVKRFGPDLHAGGMLCYRTKRNWLFGLHLSYMFGGNVKEDVVSQMRSPDGFVVDNEGHPADLRITERVFASMLVAGKIIPFTGKSNSGLLLMGGAGFLQHKINLYDAQRKVAAVNGDLSHGYDRLSAGFALTQFVGYMHISNNRLTNFYAGFDLFEAFTRSMRKVNYDNAQIDTKSRLDVLCGFRLGWVLHLTTRKPDDYYYY